MMTAIRDDWEEMTEKEANEDGVFDCPTCGRLRNADEMAPEQAGTASCVRVRAPSRVWSGEADLPEERPVVPEQVLLDDPAVAPLRGGGVQQVERLSRRLDYTAVRLPQRGSECAGEPRDEAREVALTEQDVVGAVLDPVVGECIAERDRLGAVVLATASWVRFPARPVHNALRVVEHVERVPVPTVPGIVGLLHPLSIFS